MELCHPQFALRDTDNLGELVNQGTATGLVRAREVVAASTHLLVGCRAEMEGKNDIEEGEVKRKRDGKGSWGYVEGKRIGSC